MSRKATETTTRESMWQWSTTTETKRSFLDAARQVFTEVGFSDASVADVVERAGSSVGSLYHHFGGKSELYLALWETHQSAHEHAVAAAVRSARDKGQTDSVELFIVGSKAYLEGAWSRRDLEGLFFDGDAPAGFEGLRRLRTQEWMRQNTVLLGAPSSALDTLTGAVLGAIIDSAAREVSAAPSKRKANTFIAAAEELIRRLHPSQQE